MSQTPTSSVPCTLRDRSQRLGLPLGAVELRLPAGVSPGRPHRSCAARYRGSGERLSEEPRTKNSRSSASAATRRLADRWSGYVPCSASKRRLQQTTDGGRQAAVFFGPTGPDPRRVVLSIHPGPTPPESRFSPRHELGSQALFAPRRPQPAPRRTEPAGSPAPEHEHGPALRTAALPPAELCLV
jgi:hypothetical protein